MNAHALRGTLPCAVTAAMLCVAVDARGGEPEAGRNPKVVLSGAIAETRRDIEKAKAHLFDRRREISAERVALSRKVAESTAAIKEKRAAGRSRQKARDDRDVRIRRLQERAESLAEQLTLTRSLLVEARRDAEVQLGLVDAAACAGDLEEIDRLLRSADRDTSRIPLTAEKLLGFVGRHAERASRIRLRGGRAVGPEGREVDGTFVQVGDVLTLFAARDESSPSGIVHLQHGSSMPHVRPVTYPGAGEAIKRLARGEEATVPLDLTSGVALKAARARRSFFDHARSGGVVMVPIIAIAIACLAVGLFKAVQLLRVRMDFDAPLSRLVNLVLAGSIDEAEGLARECPPPLRRLMEEGVVHRDASRQDLEEAMHEAILVEIPPLERYLAVLSVGAVVSPLLGLLGTVTGMIHTFGLISVFGTGDARLLSGGISEALVTTEAGLIVAIPLLLLHAFLSRRVRGITDGLETSAVAFTNALKSRGRSGDEEESQEDGNDSSP